MSDQIQGSAAPQASDTSAESSELDQSQDPQAQEAAVDADPTLSKTEKQEIKKNLRKLKLKVDGREFEEEIDLDDNDNLTKQFQLAKVAQKRMSESSQLEKEVRSFIEELRKNPRKVLADPSIGIDVKQLAAQIIEEEIENSKKSPEQIEREKLENELKAMRSEREKEKEEGKRQEFERLQAQEFERYDLLMTQALEKSDLPKSPYIVKKMADYMLLGLQNNIEVSPTDVVPLVREEMMEDLKEMFAVMPEEVIEKIVGKDVINKIRKKSIAKAKQAPTTTTKSLAKDTGQSSPKETAKVDKKTFKQFFGV